LSGIQSVSSIRRSPFLCPQTTKSISKGLVAAVKTPTVEQVSFFRHFKVLVKEVLSRLGAVG
jgi:hypothetical protein